MSTTTEPMMSRRSTDRPESPPPKQDEPNVPHPRRRVIIGVTFLAAVLSAALVAGITPRIAQGKRLAASVAIVTAAIPSVSFVTVSRAAPNATVDLPGTLQPLLTTALYARTPGFIRRTLVDIGARVRAGELLAEIDAPDLDQQVAQGRGIVSQNRAALQLARTQLTRWQALSGEGAVTVDELDIKVAAFNMATANLTSAEADLRRLLQLQAYERVVAPFAGVITQRNVDPGALVGTAGGASAALSTGSGSPTGSLFQIARVDTLRVFLSVPEEYATSLAIGAAAIVTVPQLPGDTLRGRVTRTSRSVDPVARTLLTEVDVANKSGAYVPGMYAQAQLRISQVDMPLNVPATALVIRAGPPQVIVVRADSTVQYQTVQIGRDHGAWVEVTGGLADGTRIVINPAENLRSGTRVRLVSADTSASVAIAARPPGVPQVPAP
jgi:membrane fusion protein (multidrug efflux system)